MKGPNFERQVMKCIHHINPLIYDKFVMPSERKYILEKINRMERSFNSFSYARYATYLTFQQSYIPSEIIQEGRAYFSGKRKLYGKKLEVSVLPVGLSINATAKYHGSVSDLEILQKMGPFIPLRPVKRKPKKRNQTSDCFLRNTQMSGKLYLTKDTMLSVKSIMDYTLFENQPVVPYLQLRFDSI